MPYQLSLVVLLLAVVPEPARAADLFVRARSAADIEELVTPAFDAVARRRVVQTIEAVLANLVRTPDREVLRLTFAARIATDFGRDVVRSSDDPRESEPVDLVLQRAEIDFRPVESLALRAGRLVLYGPLTPADVDGGALRVEAPSGLSAVVAGGREVRRDLDRLDDDLWDPAGGRDDLFGRVLETTWLLEGELGWQGGPARIRTGHRTRWRHGDRVGEQTALVAHLSLALLQATARAGWDHLSDAPDRLEARLQAPLADGRVGLWLGWRYERPVFDGDSLFNVFSLTPVVGWRSGGEVRLSERLGLSAEARLAAFDEEGHTPWAGGLGDAGARAGGGTLRGHWTPRADLALRASVAADAGRGGLLLSDEMAGQWAVLPDRAEIGLRLRHVYRDADQHPTQYGHLLAARLLGRYDLTSFGHVSAWVDVISDYRYGRSIRALFVAEFDLGPI